MSAVCTCRAHRAHRAAAAATAAAATAADAAVAPAAVAPAAAATDFQMIEPDGAPMIAPKAPPATAHMLDIDDDVVRSQGALLDNIRLLQLHDRFGGRLKMYHNADYHLVIALTVFVIALSRLGKITTYGAGLVASDVLVETLTGGLASATLSVFVILTYTETIVCKSPYEICRPYIDWSVTSVGVSISPTLLAAFLWVGGVPMIDYLCSPHTMENVAADAVIGAALFVFLLLVYSLAIGWNHQEIYDATMKIMPDCSCPDTGPERCPRSSLPKTISGIIVHGCCCETQPRASCLAPAHGCSCARRDRLVHDGVYAQWTLNTHETAACRHRAYHQCLHNSRTASRLAIVQDPSIATQEKALYMPTERCLAPKKDCRCGKSC